MLVKDLIAQFNVVARTEFNQNYKEFEPEFGNLLYEYQSGPVETMNFPFVGFLQGMEEFTGSRTHQTFPEGYNFTVVNKEWDMAVDIKRKDLERAAATGSLNGLNPYRLRISEMPKVAKDHPVELAFDMMDVGDASTYGTCFDGQNLYDTTHSMTTSAGTQNNIYTGTGVTLANLHTDVLGVLARFGTFYYQQGGTSATSKRRKLNKRKGRLLIVAPNQMQGVLFQLQNASLISTGVSNVLKGTFDFICLPFADVNDWYAVWQDDSPYKPFLYQVEKPVELDMPTANDTEARERKIFSYGAYARYAVAYGAWWKTIMVTNS